MSEKAKCPACESYTSAIHAALREGEPCPYCGADLLTGAPRATATTLTEFLLARLAEDEADAETKHDTAYHDYENCGCDYPARVLADVEAKRRIVARHSVCDDVSYGDASSCPDMRDLASIYADHEDCRQEWWA